MWRIYLNALTSLFLSRSFKIETPKKFFIYFLDTLNANLDGHLLEMKHWFDCTSTTFAWDEALIGVNVLIKIQNYNFCTTKTTMAPAMIPLHNQDKSLRQIHNLCKTKIEALKDKSNGWSTDLYARMDVEDNKWCRWGPHISSDDIFPLGERERSDKSIYNQCTP